MTGADETLAVELIRAWANRNPDRAARLVRRADDAARFMACLRLTAHTLCRTDEPVELQILKSGDGHTFAPIDVDEAVPFIRALGRFVMAAAHRDFQGAYAVWESMPEADRRTLILALTVQAGNHLVAEHGFTSPYSQAGQEWVPADVSGGDSDRLN